MEKPSTVNLEWKVLYVVYMLPSYSHVEGEMHSHSPTVEISQVETPLYLTMIMKVIRFVLRNNCERSNSVVSRKMDFSLCIETSAASVEQASILAL